MNVVLLEPEIPQNTGNIGRTWLCHRHKAASYRTNGVQN